jgi:hypothetical protein
MIDEFTNISVTGHLVMFATIVEENLSKIVFLRLLQLDGGKKDSASIFNFVISQLRLWDLNLYKLLAFGSDGASNMVGSQPGVSIGLRKEVLIPLSLSLYRSSHESCCFGYCQNTGL